MLNSILHALKDPSDLPSLRKALFDYTGCSNEECVVEKAIEKAKGTRLEPALMRLKDIAFKPAGPKELDALLDNFLLIRMGMQIEANIGEQSPQGPIRFGGVMTFDFMIPPKVYEFFSPSSVYEDWSQRRWHQLHLILNLDHRMGKGQHWTAMCIEIDGTGRRGSAAQPSRASIEYFDSYGRPPPSGMIRGSRPWPEITTKDGLFLSRLDEWTTEVRADFIQHGISAQRLINTTRHQAFGDTANCGVYSTLFLIARAKGVSFSDFNSHPIPTEEIVAQRDRLYRRTEGYDPKPV